MERDQQRKTSPLPSERCIPAVRCCSIRIDCIDLEAAVSQVVSMAVGLRETLPRTQGVAVHLCNAWTLAYGLSDPAHADRVDSGDLNLPDGMPLVWLAKSFGKPITNRVYGPDLMSGVLAQGSSTGLRHYLYGTTEATLQSLEQNIQRRFPDAQIVGREAPPFRPSTRTEEQLLATRIAESGADVVWVGLGTPQQDELVHRLRPQVAAVLIPVGAAFDFLAGNKSQAPQWMQQRGLEWLFRLCSEPRRLWRRYLIGNLRFIWGSAPDFMRALRHAPVAPRVVRPWGAAWDVVREKSRIPAADGRLESHSETDSLAAQWLDHIDLAGSLRAYGPQKLAEQFTAEGSAAEHLSQTTTCSVHELSHAAVQLLLGECKDAHSLYGVSTSDFTEQLNMTQPR